MDKQVINSFRDDYAFLSNFYICPFMYGGLEYTSAEVAFQAQKTMDLEQRETISKMSPPHAKKVGRSVKLRPDWETQKEYIMYNICRAKFIQNPELAKALLLTKTAKLIEGNTWGDKIWGKCNGVGANLLGKILMDIRSGLQTLYSRNGKYIFFED